jgi:hypothetical protein
MLIGLTFLAFLLTIPLARGRIGRLAEVRPRAGRLLALGLGTQILIISVLPSSGSQGLHAAAHLASYVLVAAFVALNLHVPYLWLIALGGLLNFVAIVANGGVMPADPTALANAGLPADPATFSNSTAVTDPVLLPLGDIFAIPASWPVSNVYLPGDAHHRGVAAGGPAVRDAQRAAAAARRGLALVEEALLDQPRALL